MLSQYRPVAVSVIAVLFPLFVARLINAPADGPIGFPHDSTGTAAWVIFYAIAAALLTLASGRRSRLVGPLCVLIPALGLMAYGRGSSATWLILAGVAPSWLIERTSPRLQAPSRGEALVIGVILVLAIPTVFFAARVEPAEAALAAAPQGDQVLNVFPAPGGSTAAVLVVNARVSEIPTFVLSTLGLGIIQVDQHGSGYWEAQRSMTDDESTGGSTDTTIGSFAKTCDFQRAHEMTIDQFGLCQGLGQRNMTLLTGLAPRDASTVEIEFRNGRVVREHLTRGHFHGYGVWVKRGDEEVIERVAFRDPSGNLLDARMGRGAETDQADSLATLAAGCRLSAQPCPTLNDDRMVVSMSLLRPAEFSMFCHATPPRTPWTIIGSVYVPTLESPFYDESGASANTDRRLIGTSIVRFVMGWGGPTYGPIVRLPSSKEPCFPTARNIP